MWRYLITLFFAAVSISHGLESRIVDTEQGPVRGYKDSDVGIFAFYGVPYAKAPTGRQRFKAPLPAIKRTGIFDAATKDIACPQMDFAVLYKRSLLITENCLIANIYVPDTTTKSLPVVVYVHGGGYVIGFGNLATYNNLVKTKEVIVVTFNYRIGAHGFLCLGTEDIPGNAGMKDQVALLRWVQKNIKNFGGNPEDVTIAGYSAGSSSVDLLMLSKMTKGLFTKVIPESGANTAAWSVQTDPIAVAKEYARSLNFTNVDDFYALEEFYKTISHEILYSVLPIGRTDATFLFSPCVERDTEGEEFLTDSPVNILKNGDYVKLPMLYGFANMEGLMNEPLFEEWKDKMSNKFSDFLPTDLQFADDAEKEEVANTIRKFYFGDGPINDEKILNYIDYFSDIFFAYATLRSVKLHVEAGNNEIYLYEYSFVHDDTPPVSHTNVRGAAHCMQSGAIADGNLTHSDESLVNNELKEMKKLLRDLWFNFVKTGRPVPEGSDYPAWPPVGEGCSPHMIIDKPLKLGGSLLKERTAFLDEIYDKHYRHPSPPPIPPLKREDSDKKIIKLEQGKVRGHLDPEGGLYSFHGIPYATAPTGRNRFKAPLPAPIWLETLDATDKGIICPQIDFEIYPDSLKQIENCLIANVFIPDTDEKNLPVVVYVHGGAFVMGHGNLATYKNLVRSKKLIAVTFNYRLGAHGFLCLGTEDVPGNAGMKDQVALLRWVQRNIARFGGNPDDVTIAGYSAGSASVDLLMVSKSAQGLFHKVIPESGSSTAIFAVQLDPIANAKRYARFLNFTDVNNFGALVEFYQTVPYDVLNSVSRNDFFSGYDFALLLSPCIERKTSEEPFLTDQPVDLIKSGNYKKLPMLYGFAKMEGLYRVAVFDQWRKEMSEDFAKFLPDDLQFENMNEKVAIAKKIKEFYFGNKPIDGDQIINYINYFTDVIFAYPTMRAIKLYYEAGHRSIYLYEYSFVHDDDPIIPYANIRGADHCAQTNAVMDGLNITYHSELSISNDFKDMKKIMREIWTNFITTGEPVPKGSELPAWPPVDNDGSPHMVLNLPLELKGPLHKERTQLWEEIYSKYYRYASPPSPPVGHTEL
ncbi:uncharacterized protein LOC123703929 [Colias croceus]|uniref:uncharacterized protein LOC123703929 n=1 Tax=Colias crocea TaxID=72248 RepID=UPI001E279F51|nr:uncharacterized protein LOC123703929 [Colias croceus]